MQKLFPRMLILLWMVQRRPLNQSGPTEIQQREVKLQLGRLDSGTQRDVGLDRVSGQQ